ncbi:MAG: efflux RND transporter periplasmic adaptor subunit [Pseudomonadota bacterium]
MVKKHSIALFTALALVGCGDSSDRQSGITVTSQTIELTVPAEGEIIASESMPVALPRGIRMGFNIAWLAPEFSEVKAGQVVARFDDQEIIRTKQETVLNVAKSDFQLADMNRLAVLEEVRIDHETGRVDGERDITEAFASIDERLMSRNEIIDALSDVEYLDVEAGFLEWQWETFDQRVQAEQNMIRAEQQGEIQKLEKQESALSMMELRSPVDGTFIYASTPWGEKIAKGRRVFPGMPVGLLPVRGKVKAKLHVAENDAVGIVEGQAVKLRLDVAPDRVVSGKVTSVSTVASPMTREDPQKFFTVEASIDDIDADVMRVGTRLRATIVTGTVSDNIVIPSQALYGDADSDFVYVINGAQPEKRTVTTGQRSPDLVEIQAGLEAGESLMLVSPEGGA